MDNRWLQALVTALVWLAVVLVLRWVLRRAFARYEKGLAEKDAAVAASRRTTFSFLLRVAIALAVLIGVWNVLSIFPATQEVARAFLASGAVLALIAGLALTTPLGNLGSGVLLAFTQPVRLGDRITVDQQTGIVDEITLSYTALATDDGRRVFVPNTTMVSTTLVNRSVDDPRRLVTVELPVRLGVSLEQARKVAIEAASQVPDGENLSVYVQVGTLTEKTAWLQVVAFAPFSADVSNVASEIREKAVSALADADLLPALVELQPFARLQHAHLDVRRGPAHGGDERGRREPDEPGRAAQAEVDREVGPPVDRDHELRPNERDSLCGALGIEVSSAPQPGPPPPDRDQTDVDGAELAHPVEEIGVTGEVDGLRPRDDVPDRIRSRPERPAAAVVLGRNGANLERPDRERLADADLEHALELPLAEQPAQAAWHDHGERLAELLERRQVEVVVVSVRDEHGVESALRACRDRSRAPEVRDAVTEQRVRQETNAVEVDDDRRMTHVLDARHARSVTRSL